MIARSTLAALLGIAATASLGSGCGSRGDEAKQQAAVEAKAIVGQLGRLKKGEILILGRKPVRYSGPYTLQPGGYVFRFEQRSSGDGSRPRLTVSLESRRGSTAKPFQLVVDTRRPRGRVPVRASGRFFVHVTTNSSSYVLRFTPRRAG